MSEKRFFPDEIERAAFDLADKLGEKQPTIAEALMTCLIAASYCVTKGEALPPVPALDLKIIDQLAITVTQLPRAGVANFFCQLAGRIHEVAGQEVKKQLVREAEDLLK